jgi:DNA-damage-inducible protein J
MAHSTNLNIRIDTDLKKNMENILSELGLTTTAAFNIFAKTVVRERRIPFALDLNETPNKLTLQALDDVLHKRNLHGPFNSVEELMEDLDAKD